MLKRLGTRSENWVSSYTIPTITNGAFVSREPEHVIGDISIIKMHEEDLSCEMGYV